MSTLQDLVDLIDNDEGMTDEEVVAELEASGVDTLRAANRLEGILDKLQHRLSGSRHSEEDHTNGCTERCEPSPSPSGDSRE